MKRFTSAKQKIGERGEAMVCMHLEKQDYTIIERNFTRKCGEIDIIAGKNGITHFIEVKSVTRESQFGRPEDNMHSFKQRKFARTVRMYLAYRKVGQWQCDLACVLLNDKERKAEIRMILDIILEN
ncbi:MAG TPA: YraN family protein [Candidatus Paceibacterota bacterium]